MPLGQIPHKARWKNVILKILGSPYMMRRIQAPVIMRMLNLEKKNLILDVGCGNGVFSYEIGEACKCMGMDRSKKEIYLVILYRTDYGEFPTCTTCQDISSMRLSYISAIALGYHCPIYFIFC